MSMNLDEALQDLRDAISRYRQLWFWQRWFNTLECQYATHAVRLKLKSVEDYSGDANEEQFWSEVEPLVAEAWDILGD